MKDIIIDNFLNINSEFFNIDDMPTIRNIVENLDDERMDRLKFMHFRDPKVFWAISFLGGALGLDRFLIGDVKIGLVKLFLNIFTLFIPQFVDLFLIQKRIRKKNFEKLMKFL